MLFRSEEVKTRREWEQGSEFKDLKRKPTLEEIPPFSPHVQPLSSTTEQEAKYCMHCGQELPHMAKFCVACGKGQSTISETTQQENLDAHFFATLSQAEWIKNPATTTPTQIESPNQPTIEEDQPFFTIIIGVSVIVFLMIVMIAITIHT